MYQSRFICVVFILLYRCIPPIYMYMHDSICELDVESIVSKGVALQHHQFWSAKTADVVECARICVKRKLCQSFNFDTNRRQCELNNEFYSDGKEVRSNEDLVYSNIAQWPAQIEPNCFARPCDIDEICIPGHLLGNTDCSYTCLKMAFSIPTPTVLPPAPTSQVSTMAPTVDSVIPVNIEGSTAVAVTTTTPTHTTELE